MVAGGIYLLMVVVMVTTGLSEGGATTDAPYVAQQLAALATGLTASYAAFASVVPGFRRRVTIWPVLSGAGWLAAMLWGCARDLSQMGTLGVGSQSDWPCVVSIAVGGGLLWFVMAGMLKKGAAFEPRLTALSGGLAALAVANVEACVTRPHAFGSVVLLWHGGTVAGMTLLLMWRGSRTLRWCADVAPANPRPVA